MTLSLEKSAHGMMIVSSVAVIALCAYVAFRPRSTSGGKRVPIEPSNVTLSLATLGSVGSPDARIGLIAFSDFECPYCVEFAREQFGRFKTDFIDTGRVRFYLAHSPGETIHKKAFRAAEASVCADEQNKTLEMFQTLFTEPIKLDATDLSEHAKTIDLDMARFKRCLDQGRGDVVRRHMSLATEAGARGTPILFLGTIRPNGVFAASHKLTGAQSYAGLSNLVQRLLNQRRPAR